MTESLGRCRASGKLIYENRATAQSAAKGVNKRTSKRDGGAVISYRCRDCQRWHIGHPISVEKSRNHATKKRGRGR